MVKIYQAQRYTPVVLLSIIFCSFIFYAFSTGITGVTLKNGDGCTCHNPTPTSGVLVSIIGPDSLQISQTATYTVTITGGTLTRGGTNIAASNGTLAPLGGDLQSMAGELTHTSPKLPSGGSVSFQFSYTAPATIGNQTLYANGNSVNFNGNNSGDNWNFASNKVITVIPQVPVELTSFTASVSENNVNLNWSTATEINNYGFEIQRSSDQINWEVSGFVGGAGNSVTPLNYIYIDKNLAAGKYYYRMRQVDYNGSFEIFTINEMILINTVADFVLQQNYPNPFNPSTRIQYSIPFDGNVQLKVYNPLGKEVTELVNTFASKGSYSSDFNAADLSSGVYYYELKLAGEADQTYSSIKKMILIK